MPQFGRVGALARRPRQHHRCHSESGLNVLLGIHRLRLVASKRANRCPRLGSVRRAMKINVRQFGVNAYSVVATLDLDVFRRASGVLFGGISIVGGV